MEGWKEYIDEESGDPYFVNIGSGETSWDRPQASVSESKPQEAAIPPLPAGWNEYIDDESGEPYFVNIASGETVWDRPGEEQIQAVEEAREQAREQHETELTEEEAEETAEDAVDKTEERVEGEAEKEEEGDAEEQVDGEAEDQAEGEAEEQVDREAEDQVEGEAEEQVREAEGQMAEQARDQVDDDKAEDGLGELAGIADIAIGKSGPEIGLGEAESLVCSWKMYANWCLKGHSSVDFMQSRQWVNLLQLCCPASNNARMKTQAQAKYATLFSAHAQGGYKKRRESMTTRIFEQQQGGAASVFHSKSAGSTAGKKLAFKDFLKALSTVSMQVFHDFEFDRKQALHHFLKFRLGKRAISVEGSTDAPSWLPWGLSVEEAQAFLTNPEVGVLAKAFHSSLHSIFQHYAWKNKSLMHFDAFIQFAEMFWYFTRDSPNILSKQHLGQIFVFACHAHFKEHQASINVDEFVVCVSLCAFCAVKGGSPAHGGVVGAVSGCGNVSSMSDADVVKYLYHRMYTSPARINAKLLAGRSFNRRFAQMWKADGEPDSYLPSKLK